MAQPEKKAAQMTRDELASYIDYSILKPQFTTEEVVELAHTGINYKCATLCINPWALDVVAPLLPGTGVGICVVADFPFGQGTAADKEMLARAYVSRGDIQDLDLVINYGLLREGKWQQAAEEIKPAIAVCREAGVVTKVILETDALDKKAIEGGVEAVIAAGGDYVKTSTGFYTGGPTVGGARDVMAHLIEVTDGRAKVKASGNVRDQAHYFDLIDMGVDRIGVGYRSVPVVLGE
ncbi:MULTISPECIES: deoxyribose-phosphate aldolase [Actinotignum]|uniref:deoxyribose-phosphate aldolase n=1 Tax=Actinotignum TaxID=1653174 RepID=UPI00254E1863|nr:MULTISPECIES: deoxyribose-phosphate aldolase [Actinotignum]MDE1537268.1 deoxyribose-phosphate aldolase [Actinotignum schaalii]MDK7272489.1 deoxyribose-phosphate aldolase [Actinotignum schaalii]MDY5145251.1 deoxyribose-phosphate aldolase [Actinotignum timonense]